jgi:hypothetical protein
MKRSACSRVFRRVPECRPKDGTLSRSKGVLAMGARKRLIAPFVGAVLALAVSVGPAAALTYVGIYTCHASSGGERHIAPDRLTITASWGAKTRGQIQAFLRSVTWNVTIDGTAVDVTPYIGTPALNGDTWWVQWAYPYGPLDSGEQVTATVEYVLATSVYDGYTITPAGTLGPFSCTIIAD